MASQNGNFKGDLLPKVRPFRKLGDSSLCQHNPLPASDPLAGASLGRLTPELIHPLGRLTPWLAQPLAGAFLG